MLPMLSGSGLLGGNCALEPLVDGIVLQKVLHVVQIHEGIINCNHRNLQTHGCCGQPSYHMCQDVPSNTLILYGCAKNQAPNSAETVDSHRRHGYLRI